MRAKMQITKIELHQGPLEVISMNAVAKSSSYPADGSDEDNSYARWSPSGELKLTVANTALHGRFKPGQKFYFDFLPAET